MPRFDHWKNYEPIEHTPQFDADGSGPYINVVRVSANCGTSEHYPEARIQIRTGSLAAAGLTVEQSARLRELLERAELDVKMRGATETVADEPRLCAWCQRAIAVGELMRAGGGLVEHAGDCPTELSSDRVKSPSSEPGHG